MKLLMAPHNERMRLLNKNVQINLRRGFVATPVVGTMLPKPGHHKARICRLTVVVNVGGGPRWGQAELKSGLTPLIAARVGAASFSNDWRKRVGERWSGCSFRQWLRSEQMKRGLPPITVTYRTT